MFRTIIFSYLLVHTLAVTSCFSDATVVQSGSPTFPLQADSVSLTVHRVRGNGVDSAVIGLPVSLYAELRDNIDTVFTYADALRRHRRELSQSVTSCLTVGYMGICVMRIFFSNNGYRSGKLVAAVDRYPFVVVLTKGLSARLKKLAERK
jgi:hypothetical protein